MKDLQSLAYVKWECKCHIGWVPKYRRKVLYGKVRKRLGEILRELCRQKGVEVIEGHTLSAAGIGRVVQRVRSPSRKAGQPPGSESLEAVWRHGALSVG